MTNNFLKRILFQTGLTAGLSLLIILAIFFVNSDLKQKSQALVSANTALAEDRTAAEDLIRLRQESARALPVLEKMRAMIPERTRLLSFSRVIADLARESNLTSNFQLKEEPIETGVINKVDFDVKLSGDYFDIMKFIKDLESAPYFISIKSISVSGGQLGQYAATIAASIVYKNPIQ